MKQTYTPNEVSIAIDLYKKYGNTGIETIAKTLGKTVKSVRAKLVREKVYIPEGPNKLKENGPSKKELIIELEKNNFNPDGLITASKPALLRVLELVKSKK